MTGNKCLLDTSAVIHFFKNNRVILEKLNTFNEVYVNSTVVGELYYGAFASSDKTKHIHQITSFLSKCILLDVDSETAKVYGSIKSDLKKQGRPIPENDIWIAASSISANLPLLTTDGHFKLLDLELIPVEL